VQAVEHRDAGCTRLAQEQPANAARYAGVANRDKRRSNLTTRAAAFSTRCSMLVVAFGAPARTALQYIVNARQTNVRVWRGRRFRVE